jgi:hypothetical protein
MTFEQVQTKLAELRRQTEALAAVGITIIPDEVEDKSYDVVWDGGELLPDRISVEDDRFRFVPSYDLDDGEAARPDGKRKYTFTGRHTKDKQ